MFAPVAQMDRVLGYEPRGRAFESLRAHQYFKGLPKGRPFSLVLIATIQIDNLHFSEPISYYYFNNRNQGICSMNIIV